MTIKREGQGRDKREEDMNRGEKSGLSREVSEVRTEGQVGGVQVGI